MDIGLDSIASLCLEGRWFDALLLEDVAQLCVSFDLLNHFFLLLPLYVSCIRFGQ